jgi:hypothetical protein
MRPRVIIGLVTVAALGSLAVAAPIASAQTNAKRGVCAEKNIGKNLHVQVGYCP